MLPGHAVRAQGKEDRRRWSISIQSKIATIVGSTAKRLMAHTRRGDRSTTTTHEARRAKSCSGWYCASVRIAEMGPLEARVEALVEKPNGWWNIVQYLRGRKSRAPRIQIYRFKVTVKGDQRRNSATVKRGSRSSIGPARPHGRMRPQTLQHIPTAGLRQSKTKIWGKAKRTQLASRKHALIEYKKEHVYQSATHPATLSFLFAVRSPIGTAEQLQRGLEVLESHQQPGRFEVHVFALAGTGRSRSKARI